MGVDPCPHPNRLTHLRCAFVCSTETIWKPAEEFWVPKLLSALSAARSLNVVHLIVVFKLNAARKIEQLGDKCSLVEAWTGLMSLKSLSTKQAVTDGEKGLELFLKLKAINQTNTSADSQVQFVRAALSTCLIKYC